MQPLWKTIWRFLQKLKSRISIRSSNSTSGNIYEGNKRLRQRDIYIPVFTVTLFLTVKIWKRPMGLLMDDRWKNAICIYSGVQFRSEKERKSTICIQPLFWAQRTHHHKHTLCWCPETPAGICQTPLHLKWSPSPLLVCPSLLSLEIKSIGKSLKTKRAWRLSEQGDHCLKMFSRKIWALADGCLDGLIAGDHLAGLNSAVACGCIISEESEGWARRNIWKINRVDAWEGAETRAVLTGAMHHLGFRNLIL